MNKLLHYLTMHPKRIFLIDGAGAVLTAIMLGLVLTRFEWFFGIPTEVLHTLAVIPILILFYDLYCYQTSHDHMAKKIRVIAIINLIYCIISMAIASYNHDSITLWGYLYIGGEILIIIALVMIELKLSKSIE